MSVPFALFVLTEDLLCEDCKHLIKLIEPRAFIVFVFVSVCVFFSRSCPWD